MNIWSDRKAEGGVYDVMGVRVSACVRQVMT